jgi:hypothetical protein
MLVIRTLLQNGDGVTLHKIVADIPHDTASLVVYVLLAAFVGLVWRYGRAHPGA